MTPSYTCRYCGWTSHNRHDILHRYCGHCHAFEQDLELYLELCMQPLIAVCPKDTTGLPLPDLARNVVSVAHTAITCPSCQRDCWIGPRQRETAEAGFGEILCYFCLFERAAVDPEIRRAFNAVVSINPDIENVPRRYPATPDERPGS